MVRADKKHDFYYYHYHYFLFYYPALQLLSAVLCDHCHRSPLGAAVASWTGRRITFAVRGAETRGVSRQTTRSYECHSEINIHLHILTTTATQWVVCHVAVWSVICLLYVLFICKVNVLY